MKTKFLPSIAITSLQKNLNGIVAAALGLIFMLCSFQSSSQTAYWLESLNNNVKKQDVASPPVSAAGATTLATPSIPMFIFQDNRNGLVYWSDAGTGSIKKVSTSGGVVTDVVTNISGPGIYPRGIYLDITNNMLYWAQTAPGLNDSIRKINISGSLPKTAISGTTVVTGIDIVRGITVDTIANEVYFADAGTGGSGKAIFRAGTSVESTELTAIKIAATGAGDQPNSVFIDRTNHFIYWSDFSAAGKIQRAATDAGVFPTSATDVFTGASVRGISVELNSNFIYWTEYPSLKIRKASLSTIPVVGATDVVTGLLDLPRNLQVTLQCQTQTFYLDEDEDGYGDPQVTTQACTQPPGYVTDNTDCNDANRNINPAAVEVCDGVDNNCNGTIDEGFVNTDGDAMADCVDPDDDNDRVFDVDDCAPLDATKWRLGNFYADGDDDGYGAGSSVSICYGTDAPAGYSTLGGDCNDGNPAIKPGATEVCDGVDNNCDGNIDEGAVDTDNDGITDCVDPDDDNDGVLDGDDCAPLEATKWRTGTFYADGDGDGYGAGSSVSLCYGTNTPAGYSTAGGDCNDGNPAIKPGATEVCDGVDNNCDGNIDEGAVDTDSDAMADCIDPDDDNDGVLDGDDCAPLDATKWRTGTFYADGDGDGYGAGTGVSLCYGTNTPAGYSTLGGDCNDGNPAIKPGATEICDGVDNNCDGNVDEGAVDTDNDGITDCVDPDDDNDGVLDGDDCAPLDATKWRTGTFYADGDGDGYGAGTGISLCYGTNTPAGYSTIGGDCNDGNTAINPGATEICGNSMDDNCNGQTDENCDVCPEPSSLYTSGITSASATLNWSSGSDPVEWLLQYKSFKKGSSKWVDLTIPGNERSVTLASLLPGKDYMWHIRAICETESTSYSAPDQFKTLPLGSPSEMDITIKKSLGLLAPGMNLYPNPSNGQFIVELRLEEKINTTANLQLTDVTGKLLLNQKAGMKNGYLQTRVLAKNVMAGGIYLVSVVVNGKMYVSKLLIEK